VKWSQTLAEDMMDRRSNGASMSLATLLFLGAIVITSPAFAGPPLLCHPFDIGSARSLPWDGTEWWRGRTDYKLTNLLADTQSLLTPTTPIIVRMETLRRAVLYASQDRATATDLFAATADRARNLQKSGHLGALELFDAAFVTEAFRQVRWLGDYNPEWRGRSQIVDSVVGYADGRALLEESLRLRPGDPTLEFAAALIETGYKGNRAAYDEHARKARAGASNDPLLARNLTLVP
jgi:hypothetical protein